MLSPRKRPRLTFIGSISPEAESRLDVARDRNDRLLKTRFESVFLKYDKNFDGIGDEINLLTGEIEVDNGHLAGVGTQEKDELVIKEEESEEDESRDRNYGHRLLRAMTEAPDASAIHKIGADDVLESIEMIAENTLVIEDSDSEDDLFNKDTPPSLPVSDAKQQRQDDRETHRDETYIRPKEEERTARSPSADSLFDAAHDGNELPLPSTPSLQDHLPMTPQDDWDSMPNSYIPNHEDLRPLIRQQVKEALEEHHRQTELTVEPAWRLPRLPVAIPISKSSLRSGSTLAGGTDMRKNKQKTMGSDAAREDAIYVNEYEDDGQDIWHQPQAQRSRRSKKRNTTETSRRVFRTGSEDPLQEGFASDDERQTARKHRQDERIIDSASGWMQYTEYVGDESDDLYTSDSLEEQDMSTLPKKRSVRRSASRTKPQKSSMSTSAPRRRGRPPKTLVTDFRILILLHEAAGLSFQEMADSNLFSTQKTAAQLEEEYVRQRSHDGVVYSSVWDSSDLKYLYDLCKHDDTILGTLQRGLAEKTYVEVGNKIAEMTLMEVANIPKSEIVAYVTRSVSKK